MSNNTAHIAITVIGGGRMGEAMVAGWINAGVVEAGRITVVEPHAARHGVFAALGVSSVSSASDAPQADVVIVAVKPQVIDDVLAGLAEQVANSLVVSVAAGITTARLESQLPVGTSVVRVMPNTPAMAGEGMAVISGGTETSSEELDIVRALFESIGKAVVIDERYQNAATAISGSGPAYFALVVDALARAGVAAGLPRDVAQLLAVQTMRGTAALLEQSEMHPEELVDGVASPGGTTIAAVNALEASGVRAAFARAVAAAVARAEELGS